MSVLLLFRLLAAHFLADFLLQPSSWVASKNTRKGRSPHLYLHVLVHGAVTYLFLGRWDHFLIPLAVMATHLLIDLGKASLPKQTIYTFLADQLLHIAVLVICWMLLTGQGTLLAETVRGYLNNTTIWILLTGYLVVIFPSAALISIATRKW